MKKLAKTLLISTVALVYFAMSSTGCTRKSPLQGTTHQASQPIILGMDNGETLDWTRAEGAGALTLAHLIGSGLTQYDSDMNIVPALATRWESRNGHRNFRFYLREAYWNDGVALTAEHFIKSWNRAVSEKIKIPYAYMFKDVRRNARGRLTLSAPSPRVLEVELSKPIPYFPSLVAFPVAYPHRTEVEAEWKESYFTPVRLRNLGQYRVRSHTPNVQTVLEPNPYYWGGPPKITHLSIRPKETQPDIWLSLNQPHTATHKNLGVMQTQILRPFYYGFVGLERPFDKSWIAQAFKDSVEEQTWLYRTAKVDHFEINALGIPFFE